MNKHLALILGVWGIISGVACLFSNRLDPMPGEYVSSFTTTDRVFLSATFFIIGSLFLFYTIKSNITSNKQNKAYVKDIHLCEICPDSFSGDYDKRMLCVNRKTKCPNITVTGEQT